jgi:hypothetical protein
LSESRGDSGDGVADVEALESALTSIEGAVKRIETGGDRAIGARGGDGGYVYCPEMTM